MRSGPDDRFVFAGILVLLLFAPLAFGAVHVWAYSVLELGVLFLAGVWGLRRLIDPRGSELQWIRPAGFGFLLLFLLLILVQMIPMPEALLSLISPATFADKAGARSILSPRVGENSTLFFPLSYSLHFTLREGIKLFCYLLFFFLVLHLLGSKKRIDRMIHFLLLIGVFEAGYGFFQGISKSPAVWWWRSRSGEHGLVSGTFIGSNHFGFYMLMIFFTGLGFLAAQEKRSKRIIPGLGGPKALLQRIVIWFSPESANPKQLFLLSVTVFVGAAILLSGSKGAILSLAFGLFVFASLFLLRRREDRRISLLVMIFGLFFVVLGIYSVRPTAAKFGQLDASLENRLKVSFSMLPMMGDYPGAGTGWGNFSQVFPRYAPKGYYDGATGGHPHNDWLQAGVESGIPGLGLILGAFFLYLRKLIGLWRRRRNRHAVGIGAGVVAGLAAVSLHSFFDFSMHIPANPLTLAAVLGIGYGALHRKGHGFSESFFYRRETMKLTLYRRILFSALALLILGVIGIGVIRHFRGEIRCPTETNSTMNLVRTPTEPDLLGAIGFNPLNPEYHYRLARFYQNAAKGAGALRKSYTLKAIDRLERAIRLNPTRGNYWLLLAKECLLLRSDGQRYVNHWLPLAGDAFDMAVKLHPDNLMILAHAAQFWTWRSGMLPLHPEQGRSRTDAVRHFQDLYRRMLRIDAGRWKWAVGQIRPYYKDDAVIYAIVPEENETLRRTVLQHLVEKNDLS